MLGRLKKKWQVDNLQLILILIVFAIAGSTTAFLTRQVSVWLGLSSDSYWYWLLKIFLLLVGYWVILLLVALPFGQIRFFWKFVTTMFARLSGSDRRRKSRS